MYFESNESIIILGLEALYLMTNSRDYTFRMDANTSDGFHAWGEWNTFKIANGVQKYMLKVFKKSNYLSILYEGIS